MTGSFTIKDTDQPNDPIDGIQGQFLALGAVLQAVIQTLPPSAAKTAAKALANDRCVNQGMDAEQGIEPATAASRDAIIEAYIGLLASLANG